MVLVPPLTRSQPVGLSVALWRVSAVVPRRHVPAENRVSDRRATHHRAKEGYDRATAADDPSWAFSSPPREPDALLELPGFRLSGVRSPYHYCITIQSFTRWLTWRISIFPPNVSGYLSFPPHTVNLHPLVHVSGVYLSPRTVQLYALVSFRGVVLSPRVTARGSLGQPAAGRHPACCAMSPVYQCP